MRDPDSQRRAAARGEDVARGDGGGEGPGDAVTGGGDSRPPAPDEDAGALMIGEAQAAELALERTAGGPRVSKRVNRTLKRISGVLRRRWHDDIWVVDRWLGRGAGQRPVHQRLRSTAAAAVAPGTAPTLTARPLAWKKIDRMRELLWPPVTIRHPWPNRRFAVKHPR